MNLSWFLPGLFPPAPVGIDTAVRRVLLAMLLLLAGAALAGSLMLSRSGPLAPALAVAAVVCLVAAAVPWHRLAGDAFSVVGIGVVVWTAWFIHLTGGATSPHMALAYLSVVVLTVPLSLRLGLPLGTAAAIVASLPLVYEDSLSASEIQAVSYTHLTLPTICSV